jgi:hypothetical protein
MAYELIVEWFIPLKFEMKGDEKWIFSEIQKNSSSLQDLFLRE